MLRVVLALTVLLSLAACGTRLNPLNWFGGEREQRITVETSGTRAADEASPFVYVTELTQLSVEQTTSGAIVRATGVTPVQGYYEAELDLVEQTETTLVYEFIALPPLGNETAGLQEISVGTELTVGELAGIRSITVIAQNNRRTVGRR